MFCWLFLFFFFASRAMFSSMWNEMSVDDDGDDEWIGWLVTDLNAPHQDRSRDECFWALDSFFFSIFSLSARFRNFIFCLTDFIDRIVTACQNVYEQRALTHTMATRWINSLHTVIHSGIFFRLFCFCVVLCHAIRLPHTLHEPSAALPHFNCAKISVSNLFTVSSRQFRLSNADNCQDMVLDVFGFPEFRGAFFSIFVDYNGVRHFSFLRRAKHKPRQNASWPMSSLWYTGDGSMGQWSPGQHKNSFSIRIGHRGQTPHIWFYWILLSGFMMGVT